MAHKGSRIEQQAKALVALVILFCGLSSQLAGAAEVRQFANGISATIYTPAEILGRMKSSTSGNTISIQTPHGTVELSNDDSPVVPFDQDFVARALRDIRDLGAGVDVTVYILPNRPVGSGSSFARQDAIYLAPGTGTVDEGTVAYITTHEMGHVLTWAFMDSYPARWDAYMQLRGLDAASNGPLAVHADRAREILAEDLRFLFGGPNATWPGSIENHDLTLPDRVPGLAELLAGFFVAPDQSPALAVSSVYPNPCNPLTTVTMDLPRGSQVDGSRAVLRIFDIRGALIRTIEGGNLANNRVSVQWKGSTDSGTAAASGRYVYVLQVEDLVAKGSVSLVR